MAYFHEATPPMFNGLTEFLPFSQRLPAPAGALSKTESRVTLTCR